MRRLFLFAALLGAVAACAPAGMGKPPAGDQPGGPQVRVQATDTVRLAFVATNDIHGGLLPTTPSWARGDTIGGAAVLAGYIGEIRSRFPGATVWLDGGDVMQGTLISNLTNGRSTVEVLGAMGLDAAAIGNHEFDWGVDTMAARIEDAPFPWLSANIFEKATGERPAWARPYAWIERAGLRIAVIGASTVETPFTTMPAYAEPYEFHDIADVVNELAPRLKAEGADLVVLTTHAGAIADSTGTYHGEIVDAARRITAPLDLIVSGHTHSFVETVENGIPIVQSRANTTAVGLVTLSYDRGAGRVVDHSIRVTTTWADSTTPDPGITALVERYRADVRAVAERPIATLATTIGRGNRGDEWVMGNLIADAQRWATGAQIAVMNPGGVRAEIAAGPVSYAEVFAVQPFQNVLVRMELAGREVEALLEAAVTDRIGHVSGVRFSFDPTRPPGDRVRDAALDDGEVVVADGEAVAPDKTYTVTVNNFMAAGGDSYEMLLEVAEPMNTGLVDSDVLADYLAQAAQPVRYEPAPRITRLAPWPVPGGE